MRAMMKHSQTGALLDVPLGFGWTTLFFGFFPALFRGDIKNALIIFVLAMFTGGFSNLVMCFLYNKMYVNDLVSNGWMPADQASSNTLRMKGIAFMDVNTNSPIQNQQPPVNYQPQVSPSQNIVNIVCNVCQRKFDSQAHLDNHIINSELHKKNMEMQAMQDWKNG